MKKGKVLGKSQIILAVMVLALGAAVWFNMKYSSSGGTKYLGEAQYVNSENSELLETSGNVADYFETARAEREASYKAAQENITEAIKTAGGDAAALSEASKTVSDLALRQKKETNIETLLKAKGFPDAIAIIGQNDVNVVVKGESLSGAQTVQIQDIAMAQSGFAIDKIKILAVK